MTYKLIPDRIILARNSGKLIPFVGAGVSRQAGLPDWAALKNDLTNLLLARTRKQPGFRTFLRSATPPQIVEHAKRTLTTAEYEVWLNNTFDPPGITPSALHISIAQLPCKVFVTTNFDVLLEHAIAIVDKRQPTTCTTYDQLINALEGDRRIVIKLHGTIHDVKTLVFAQNEYDSFPHTHRGLLGSVKDKFDLSTFLFVGYSFSDPDLLSVLGTSMFDSNRSKRDDFMIANKPPVALQDFWAARNIKLIATKTYSDTRAIIDDIRTTPRKTAVPKLARTHGDVLRSEILSSFGDTEHFTPVLSRKRFSVRTEAISVTLLLDINNTVDARPSTIEIPKQLHCFDSLNYVHVITGPPGSGKSIALQIIASAKRRANIPVILVPLGSIPVTSDDFLTFLASRFPQRERNAASNEIALMLAEGAIVLFDGLEETGGAALGRTLRLIEGLKAGYPAVRIFVAARDNFESLPEGAIMWRIAPMDENKIRSLIERFVLTNNPGRLKYDDIARTLFENNGLLTTPFLVVASGVVIAHGKRDIRNETKIIRSLLTETIRLDAPDLDDDRINLAFQCLGALCKSNWEAGERSVVHLDIVSLDRQYHDILTSTALFKRTGVGTYVVTFRIFFEYLVALAIVDQNTAAQFIERYSGDARAANIMKYIIGVTHTADEQGRLLAALWRLAPQDALISAQEAKGRDKFLKDIVTLAMEEETVSTLKGLTYRVDEAISVDVIARMFDKSVRNGYVLYHCVDLLSRIAARTPSELIKNRCAQCLSTFFAESHDICNNIDMITVDAGKYCVGQDTGVDSDEEPKHTVHLNAYTISTTLVTNEQFRLFNPNYVPDTLSVDDQMPVVNITWFEAQLFCRWLFPMSGRLPTEAEWEVASRGYERLEMYWQYPWGDEADTTKANFDRSRRGASQVREYPPNRLGIYDPVGNVFQWCEDWYDGDAYKGDCSDNPAGPPVGRWKVMRGGCWAREPEVARCSYRVRQVPATRDVLVGFRICNVGAQRS